MIAVCKEMPKEHQKYLKIAFIFQANCFSRSLIKKRFQKIKENILLG